MAPRPQESRCAVVHPARRVEPAHQSTTRDSLGSTSSGEGGRLAAEDRASAEISRPAASGGQTWQLMTTRLR